MLTIFEALTNSSIGDRRSPINQFIYLRSPTEIKIIGVRTLGEQKFETTK